MLNESHFTKYEYYRQDTKALNIPLVLKFIFNLQHNFFKPFCLNGSPIHAFVYRIVTVKKILTPLHRPDIEGLRICEQVLLSGDILVFRDQVHRILCEMVEKGEELPFSLKDEVVYYCGPTPARHGMPVGSAGPTTASRMDMFTEPLLEQGLAMMIGKGNRSQQIAQSLHKHRAVYMVAIGGTGALIAQHITASRVIAFPELGTEAARIFTVSDMPLIVGIDSNGDNAFYG